MQLRCHAGRVVQIVVMMGSMLICIAKPAGMKE
jgi:hypothetical protein